jgi:hypothetical protein
VIWEATFQTVGTENLGAKISVGGTGYLLRLGYVRTYSERLTMTAGISHLSTHLTRDLDDKLDEERSHGRTIPIVEDESEYNVVYLKANVTLTSWPFTPALEAVLQPINFQFNGGRAGDVRPVYVRSRTTLWRGDQRAIVAETEHEFGKNAFNRFVAAFEFTSATDGRRRVEMFVSASPGHNLHVSPMIGGVRDGIAFGLRMHFRAS